MKTGLKEFDAVCAPLGLGGLVCVAGRPCNGKTVLLLDLALRIHRRYETNVVFATARELPEDLLARAPVAVRHLLVELPARDLLREDIEFPVGRGPCVYLVDTQAVGPVRPHYIAHRLNAEHAARCDLLVSDGWSVTADRVTTVERAVAGVPYRLNLERAALTLAATTLVEAKRFAKASGVATVYGIRTAWHDDQERGPRLEDLLRQRSAVSKHALRTVLLHRPELYLAHDEGREAVAGIVELAAADERSSERRRVRLQYDAARRRLRSGGRGRGKG
jgi:replicative DNA helicase